MGTTIHAWLKLVIDRMPEPLVNMGTEKTAADRVKMRGGTLTARHYGIVPNWTEKGMVQSGCRAAVPFECDGHS